LSGPESGGPDVDAAACPPSTTSNTYIFLFSTVKPFPSVQKQAVPAIDVAHLSAQQEAEFPRLCRALLSTSGSGESPIYFCCWRVGQSATTTS